MFFLVEEVSGDELTREIVLKMMLMYMIPIDKLTISLVNSSTKTLSTQIYITSQIERKFA